MPAVVPSGLEADSDLVWPAIDPAVDHIEDLRFSPRLIYCPLSSFE